MLPSSREREKLAKKINEDAERRKRHRQFGEAVALGVTSTAAAVALLVFDVIHAAVPVICLITAAASLDVAALRTGFGARRGGAIITWVALIVGIAALVAAFVLAPSDSVPRP